MLAPRRCPWCGKADVNGWHSCTGQRAPQLPADWTPEPFPTLGPTFTPQIQVAPMTHDFSTALLYIKAGKKVSRQGWNGKGMHIEIQRPDAGSKMTLPYIYMKTADNNVVPWLASQTDILAEDWVVL